MFDLILIILLAFGAFRGFRRGLLMELITIIAFVAGIILGLKLMDLGGSVLEILNENFGRIAPFLIFILVFVLTIVAVNLVGKAFKKAIDFTPLGLIDNLVGSVIGCLKWAFAISLIFWVGSLIGLDLPSHVTSQSRLHPYIVSVAPTVFDYASSLFPFARDFFDSASSDVDFAQGWSYW